MAKNTGQILFTGRLANMVGQKMRGGYVLRKFMVPTNPQSTLQTLFRDRMNEHVARWVGLPAYARDMWRIYAQSLSTPETTYDGYTLFLSCNLRLVNSGQIAIDTPPIGKIFTPVALTSSSLSVAQDAPGSSTIDLTCEFDPNELVAPNRGGFTIQMYYPIGSRQPSNCPQQTIGSYDIEAADTSPLTITIDTGLNPDLFPRTFYFRLGLNTQVGRPAGYTDWTSLEFAAAP